LATQSIDFLINEAGSGSATSALIGMQGGHVKVTNLEEMPRLIDAAHSRPKEQWWLSLKPLARLLSQPGAAQDASVPMKESKS
jgi:6-phosphofructokinase 1